MPETPRSSFRLRERTLARIEEIKAALIEQGAHHYWKLTKTDIIEMGVDELHRKHCPKPGNIETRAH